MLPSLKSAKSLGAIYTPNSITTLMAQSVLVDYINSELSVSYSSYDDLLMENKKQNQQRILERLKNIKIVDPACGSGHFLLDMLFQLEAIYYAFQKNTPSLVSISKADIRQQIVLNNLFGVDINPKAVGKCKLRLLHTLAEKKGQFEGQQSHSNIDLHIRCGNSVLGIFEQPDSNSTALSKKTFVSLMEDRNKLLREVEESNGFLTPAKRDELRQSTNKLNLYCTEQLLGNKKLQRIENQYSVEQFNARFIPFHWAMEFSQVMGMPNGGFDIVIGNPPYVKADSQDQGFQEYREIVRKLFSTFEEKWDLYIAFLELGMRILKPGGLMSFILSDAFSTAKYASKMRKLLLSKKLLNVSFFPEIKIFPDVGVHNILLTVKNEPTAEDHTVKRILYGESVMEPKTIEMIDPTELQENVFRYTPESDSFFTMKMENTIPLGDICYISKGMVLNSDEKKWKGEFKKNDLINPKKSQIHCKPYVENKFIREFCILSHQYLEYDTNRVPSKVSRPTFPELYTNEKILVGKMGGRAVYDDQGMFCNDSLMIVIPYHKLSSVENRVLRRKAVEKALIQGSRISRGYDLRYLLGILNSSHATRFFNRIRSHRLKNYVNPNELKQLPIFQASQKEQEEIISLVKRLEENRNQWKEANREEIEKQNNVRYEKLLDSLDKHIEKLYSREREP
jgi:type I restriction-modification system DNA methylase subunit